jgi:hypothetical protein
MLEAGLPALLMAICTRVGSRLVRRRRRIEKDSHYSGFSSAYSVREIFRTQNRVDWRNRWANIDVIKCPMRNAQRAKARVAKIPFHKWSTPTASTVSTAKDLYWFKENTTGGIIHTKKRPDFGPPLLLSSFIYRSVTYTSYRRSDRIAPAAFRAVQRNAQRGGNEPSSPRPRLWILRVRTASAYPATKTYIPSRRR